MAKRASSKRELIDTGRNKMYGKRDVQGRFREMDDTSRSLSSDRRRSSNTPVKSGHGDRGDRKRS
jgi:hypothetical protein